MIMLVALASCFKTGEEYLTEDQILSRGFTPIMSYGKACISGLLASAVIQLKVEEPLFPDSRDDQKVSINRPGLIGEDLEDFIYRRAQIIIGLLAQSLDCRMYLEAFSNELVSCECIEYCDFYAKRSDLAIVNHSHNNAKLKLMILECPLEKIYTLLWRSIKMNSKKVPTNGDRTIEFSKIINTAFELYVTYKKLNLELEGYSKPNSLKISILSGLIELFKRDSY